MKTSGHSNAEEIAYEVRVLVDGAWGFASSTIVTEEEAARVGQLAVRQASLNPWGKTRTLELAPAPVVADGQWETPIDVDPWDYFPSRMSSSRRARDRTLRSGFTASGTTT